MRFFFPVSLHNKNNKKKKQQNKTRLTSSWITVLSSYRFWWLFYSSPAACSKGAISTNSLKSFFLSEWWFCFSFQNYWLLYIFSPFCFIFFSFFSSFCCFSVLLMLVNVQVSQLWIQPICPLGYLKMPAPACTVVAVSTFPFILKDHQLFW